MREVPAQFGPDGNLIGILTPPATGVAAQPIGLLLFNAGVIHRVGPHRLNVKLAARVAQQGFTTFRFDLAGQGDSRAAGSRLPFSEQAVHDIKAAMDHVERATGVDRFVIFGVCSGAVNAFHAALADGRVIGIAMFDGFWYHSRWTSAARRWKRFRATPWRDLFQRFAKAPSRSQSPPDTGSKQDAGVFGNDGMGNPPREVFLRQVGELVARDVRVYFIYSGSIIEQVSYEKQLRHAFHGEHVLGDIEIRLFEHLDHTIISLDVQKEVCGIVDEWLCRVTTERDRAPLNVPANPLPARASAPA